MGPRRSRSQYHYRFHGYQGGWWGAKCTLELGFSHERFQWSMLPRRATLAYISWTRYWGWDYGVDIESFSGPFPLKTRGRRKTRMRGEKRMRLNMIIEAMFLTFIHDFSTNQSTVDCFWYTGAASRPMDTDKCAKNGVLLRPVAGVNGHQRDVWTSIRR